jgi:hypothetical protein
MFAPYEIMNAGFSNSNHSEQCVIDTKVTHLMPFLSYYFPFLFAHLVGKHMFLMLYQNYYDRVFDL